MFAPEVSAAADGDERDEEDDVGHVVGPTVLPHKRLNVVLEGEESDDGEGDDQLHREDQEHLGTHTHTHTFIPLYPTAVYSLVNIHRFDL